MAELYDIYRRMKGWWNKGHEFTIKDFLAMTLYYEYASAPRDAEGPFTWAATTRYWWWKNHTGASNEVTAILNYVGTRAVMRKRYEISPDREELNKQTAYHPVTREGGYDLQRAERTAGWVVNPDNDEYRSITSIGNTGDWGNLTMYPTDVRGSMRQAETGLGVDQVIYRYGRGNDNDFVIVTYWQDTYWKQK